MVTLSVRLVFTDNDLFIVYFSFSPDGARCPNGPQVILDPSCQRSHNETCSYTCNIGYTPTKKSVPNNVTCTDVLPRHCGISLYRLFVKK